MYRNGSVVADTTLRFEESADVSTEVIRTALSNATEDQRQGLNLTQIEGEGLKDEQWGAGYYSKASLGLGLQHKTQSPSCISRHRIPYLEV